MCEFPAKCGRLDRSALGSRYPILILSSSFPGRLGTRLETPSRISHPTSNYMTSSVTVRLFFILSVLLCSVNNGFKDCTVCDFAHARPIMLSILLVGASVSEPRLVDSTDALLR